MTQQITAARKRQTRPTNYYERSDESTMVKESVRNKRTFFCVAGAGEASLVRTGTKNRPTDASNSVSSLVSANLSKTRSRSSISLEGSPDAIVLFVCVGINSHFARAARPVRSRRVIGLDLARLCTKSVGPVQNTGSLIGSLFCIDFVLAPFWPAPLRSAGWRRSHFCAKC